MENLRMFIPLTKVDVEQRLVYGLATGETLDRSGEICDYATTKPYYEKWSADIAKASGGKSLGNLRAMHGKVAAGKVTAIDFNDGAKQIEIAAKVIDDGEWKKVVEGVYTGFSQGGGYVKRWTDDKGHQRYTAEPSEVSLVDLPCLDTATFQIVKAAGAIEEKHFAEAVQVKAEPSNADVAKKAGELAKEAGREGEWEQFLDAARKELQKAALPALPEMPKAVDATPPAPGDEVEQVWKAKDGSTHAKKVDALAKNAEIAAAASVAPATQKVRDALGELAERLGIEKATGGDEKRSEPDPDVVSPKKRARDGKPTADDLEKDLYRAARFAELLESLRSLAQSSEYEAVIRNEPEDGAFAKQMKAWVSQGCALLVSVVQAESDSLGGIDADMAMAAGSKLSREQIDALGKAAAEVEPLGKILPSLRKAGARNSKADSQKIQAMHDHAVDLGASCAADKAAEPNDLAKALADMTAGRDVEKARGDALQKTLDDQIMPMLTKIGEKVDKIERQPLPLPFANGQFRVVDKGGQADVDAEEQLQRMAKDDPDGPRILLHKISQSRPQQMNAR